MAPSDPIQTVPAPRPRRGLRRRIWRDWTRGERIAVGILVPLGALYGLGAVIAPKDKGSDYGVPKPDAQTCANLQAAIDGGLSKRAAIDLAILQADEPGADNILRNMLYLC